MTTWGNREGFAAYVREVAGPVTTRAAIATHVNEQTGARLAGPLVGQWLDCKVSVSAGNLAAFARAYGKSPLSAFVAAGVLDETEAVACLDDDELALLGRVRRSVIKAQAELEGLVVVDDVVDDAAALGEERDSGVDHSPDLADREGGIE